MNNRSVYLLMAILMGAAMLVGCDQTGQDDATAGEQTEAVPQQEESTYEPAPVCDTCGTVSSITPVSAEGESSGAGAAIGAVVGGLLGNQVGGGSGKKAATAVGAVGGAVAGNEIEKKRNAVTYYEVVVAMDGGGQRVVNVSAIGGLQVGMEVEVVGNDLKVL